MLSVVWIVNATKGWYEAGVAVERRAAANRSAQDRVTEAARG